MTILWNQKFKKGNSETLDFLWKSHNKHFENFKIEILKKMKFLGSA